MTMKHQARPALLERFGGIMPMAIANVSLADGTVVSCLQRHEVPIVHREVQSYFSKNLRLMPGDTVFDVGAHIGLFSLEVYQRCQRDVRLYAFEPVEDIFNVLRANIERCTSGDQLKIFDFGLSSTSEPAVFAYYPHAPVLSTAYPDEKADLEVVKEATLNNIMHFAEAPLALRCLRRVPACLRAPMIHHAIKKTLCSKPVMCRMETLSRVVRDHGIERIDFLKIDAEKAELEIFRGIEAQDWPKIQQVVVDVHDSNDRLDTMTALLHEHGLSKIVVDQPPTLKQSNIYSVFATRQ
jgi:FkbM family methyltransferase